MQKIIILDFGSQTTQLIGRRVRELDTFCEIMPYNKFPKDDPDVIGVILSGSPYSVHRAGHLLWCPVHLAHTGWQGGKGRLSRVRTCQPPDGRHHQSPVPWLRTELAGMDVAW